MTAETEYRPIPGWPGYRAGSDGTIWSQWKRGTRPRKLAAHWSLLRQNTHPAGYLTITLSGRKTFRTHQLILLAFAGVCPFGMECRHADGNKANNAIANLSWGTKADNEADKIRHGTLIVGEKHPHSRLTVAMVQAVRKEYATSVVSFKSLAARCQVSERAVRAAVRRETWRHVN